MTATQLDALEFLAYDSPMTETIASVQIGRSYRRTLNRLEALGYARWFPYSRLGGTEGVWKITHAGRKALPLVGPDAIQADQG